jgi:methyl acetate hydrolase
MAQERVEQACKAATDAKKIPGVAAIALDRSGKQLFKGAYGVTNLNDASTAEPVTSSTPFMIWSCTKIVTSVCALQLVEQGKLQLDDFVEKYVPEIANIKVIDGFNDDGSPKLREPKTKATILMLMTHTAGFAYDFFDPTTLAYHTYIKRTPANYGSGERAYFFDTPILFDPGSRYNYGINTDWLGFVVEAISGLKLNEYVQKNILDPLGMKDSGAQIKNGSFAERGALIHFRGEDGSLTANPAMAYAENPDVYGGGHFLYSTLDDFSTFLLALLNGGTEPRSGVQILKKETVSEYLFEDQIHKICSADGIGEIDTTIPMLSLKGTFLPGQKKGWSCGLMLNEGSLKGRSAGSGSWAGLGNLYFWIDPKGGKLGLIMTGILPFMDTEVLHLFDELERAVYGHESSKEIGEAGGNYSVSKL